MRKFLSSAAVAAFAVVLVALPALAAPSDPYYELQWGLHNIQAEQAWTTSNGTGALVAVVDSGVDLTHPDLDSQLVPGADFVDPNGQDGPQDENGHGTHVAGIVAAETGNGVGVAGTAPGAKVLPVRVLDETGSGSTDEVAAGIRYAADNGADVINLSLGFLSGAGEIISLVGALDPVYDAIAYAQSSGAVVVVAAGNDSVPLCAEPASAPGVICVGATDRNDIKAWYSNSDTSTIDNFVTAPGGQGGLFCDEDVYSTYLRSEPTFCGPETGYESIAGTSMAAPHVSGIAALLAAKGLPNTAIVDCILGTADDLGTAGWDPVYGNGRVNANSAVAGC